MIYQPDTAQRDRTRIRDQRLRDMPTAMDRTGLTLGQKLESIGAVATVAVPFAAWLFGREGAGWTALLLVALAATVAGLSRRPM